VLQRCPIDPKSCDIDTHFMLLAVSGYVGDTLARSPDLFARQKLKIPLQHDLGTTSPISDETQESSHSLIQAFSTSSGSQTFPQLHTLLSSSALSVVAASGWDANTLTHGEQGDISGGLNVPQPQQ
jgi:hypothetical protein